MQAFTAAGNSERMTGFISVCRASTLPGNILAKQPLITKA
jgi:hypothetical protein